MYNSIDSGKFFPLLRSLSPLTNGSSGLCQRIRDSKFHSLGAPQRIWAVSAIHGDAQRLTWTHDELWTRLQPGDRVIYHGNYAGFGEAPRETIDEILTFRRMFLARPGALTSDLVYLRGGQEEMWQKLLQLQFTPDPANLLLWMLGNGLSSTLQAYGISAHDGIEACRYGVMGITKWTAKIREQLRKCPGHEIFNNQLMRAAHTNEHSAYPMLFVHAGIDQSLPLDQQNDAFWWAGAQFETIHEAYAPFQKVVRGFDPEHKGLKMNCVTATIDGGCGFGGALVCAGFDARGNVLEILEN